MKLERKEKSLLFSETILPDIFFTDYLPELSGDVLKLYLYMNFLSKFNKTIKINDLSKKLSLAFQSIKDGLDSLENMGLIMKKSSGYIVLNLQEVALYKLYSPNLTASEEKVESLAKNQARSRAIEHINNTYFQGVMSPSWYNDIDIWFQKFDFDEQVMIALFEYCFNHSALHKNYVQKVAENWGASNVKTWTDLDLYYQKQEKIMKITNAIKKKLGKPTINVYEKAFIEKWVYDFGYDMDIIEIALKRATLKQAPTFAYFDSLISSWHERSLKTKEEILTYIDQRSKQNKMVKDINKKTTSKLSYAQRAYDNLDFLYANNVNKEA